MGPGKFVDGKLGPRNFFGGKLYFIYFYWIYTANDWGIYEQLNIYVYWYWIYSGIGYILPTIGGYILIWIYSANNWEIYVNYGVFVRPSGAGLQIVHLLECVSFFKAYSATLHPPIDIYPPIVGRIYPILI